MALIRNLARLPMLVCRMTVRFLLPRRECRDLFFRVTELWFVPPLQPLRISPLVEEGTVRVHWRVTYISVLSALFRPRVFRDLYRMKERAELDHYPNAKSLSDCLLLFTFCLPGGRQARS